MMERYWSTIGPQGTDTHSYVQLWHQYRSMVVIVGLLVVIAVRFLQSRLSSPAHPTTLGQSTHTKTEHIYKPPIVVVPARLNAKSKAPSKRVTGIDPQRPRVPRAANSIVIKPKIFYFSLAGSTKRRAEKIAKDFLVHLDQKTSPIASPELHDLAEVDFDEYFVTAPKSPSNPNLRYLYLLVLPTYNIDTIIDSFIEHLKETHHDFRIDTASLSDLAGYSVFGFGDKTEWKTESEGYCSQAIQVDRWMAKLTGRKRAFPLGLGDVSSDVDARMDEWRLGVQQTLMDIAQNAGLGEGVQGSGDAMESDEDDPEDLKQKPSTSARSKSKPSGTRAAASLIDLEDIKGINEEEGSSTPKDFTTKALDSSLPPSLKEMVPKSSPTHAALTKQGYSIIGSHSGVKICRWTKSALRGRGSCYKYSFYGIKSHLCMETTPSLSCSNKCVFCWRHGTNPVGTTWRWQVDPPELIFAGAKEAHLKKIKMLRGVPGLRAERFQEAMRIRHCALSLVGEPIFYPHINEFVRLLHSERISSFLVCNAQHPEHLEALKVVTQLYVSIDASNRESLRKIDRPLHRDFWERFLRCLDILREKRFRMRTVFRLTLVKGFNIDDEVEGYADLVARGLPCFVEIKGVTYCGTSTSAGVGLSMQNVPFYEEITLFVEALNEALGRRGLDYGIAAEHAHSCCVLLGSRRFFMEGKWHTLIDYDRFFECLNTGKEFAPEDYVGPPTPEWATWGRGGFDPADERVDRKGRKLITE